MRSLEAEHELELQAREAYIDRLDGLGPKFECARCGAPLSDAEMLHGSVCEPCQRKRAALTGAECVPLSVRRRYRGEHAERLVA
jgi:hypothetical protein